MPTAPPYRPDFSATSLAEEGSMSVAISDGTILLLSSIGFFALGLSLYVLVLRRLKLVGDDVDDDDGGGGGNRRAGRRRLGAGGGEGGGEGYSYGEMLDRMDDADVAGLSRAERRARAKFRMKRARRATAGTEPRDGEAGAEAAAVVRAGGGENDDPGVGDPGNDGSRKDRQRVAKAVEREERKRYAEEARLRREAEEEKLRKNGKMKSKKKSGGCDEGGGPSVEEQMEELFPTRRKGGADDDDPLSDYFLRDAVAQRWKEWAATPQTTFTGEGRPPKLTMTVRRFVRGLRRNGCVSADALANEYSVSISDVVRELDRVNEIYEGQVGVGRGAVGMLDETTGIFHCVTEEMIEGAVRRGEEAGRIDQ